MGINVYLRTRNGDDCPEWDTFRYVGDKLLPMLIDSIPHHKIGDDDWCVTRPNDIEMFRLLMHDSIQENTARWDKLCEILAKNPAYGLYFCY